MITKRPRIFSDFDGTISRIDSLVWLLDRYVDKGWLDIERRVEDGSLSEEQGLREEIALISAPFEEAAAAVLAAVPLDPGFAAFAAYCEERGWPLQILSGGLEPLIRRFLEKAGLGELSLRANGLDFDADGRWRVRPATSPRINALCNHCKSHWVLGAQSAGERVIYIGDGTTDRCPAGHADLVFAKDGLRRWCEERSIPHRAFAGFAEIQAWFESAAGRSWLAV